MRAALLIVLGLAIGIIGTFFVMNALAKRDPLPHAVMTELGYHMGSLQQARKAQHCDATASQNHLQAMQSIEHDIAAAFPEAPQDFTDHANHLRDALQTAVQAAPQDCPALAAALKPVGQACEDCHQKYR